MSGSQAVPHWGHGLNEGAAVIGFLDSMQVGDYAAIVKFNNTNAAKASVVLKLRDRRGLSPATVVGISNLVAASVESVAENASDSWVAPLFYYVLFGLPGAVVAWTVSIHVAKSFPFANV